MLCIVNTELKLFDHEDVLGAWHIFHTWHIFACFFNWNELLAEANNGKHASDWQLNLKENLILHIPIEDESYK